VELETIISECTFSDAAQRLPAALLLIVDRPGDFPELANAVIRFCKGNAHELAVPNISEEVASLRRAGFLGHLNRFICQCVRREREPFDVLIGGCVAGGDDRDHYLDDLRNAAIRSTDGVLVDRIASEWANCFGNAVRSAHFVDLCVRARHPELLQLKLYRTGPFGSLVRDDVLFHEHWQCAAKLIECQCPTEYLDWIAREFNV